MLHNVFPRVSQKLLISTPGNSLLNPTSIILLLQMKKLNSERLSDTFKAPYLFKWGCEFYAIPKSVTFYLPSNRYSYIFPHQLDFDGLFSINLFSGGDSLHGTVKTKSNSFKLLRLNTGTSDGELHRQASSIWDCKSNVCLFIWVDVDRINSGHLPLISLRWNNVLDTLSS